MKDILGFPRTGRKLLSAPLSSPDGNTLVYSHASFDSMLIIIIAGFIVSMLFAWVLKSIASCVFCCNREVVGIHSSPGLAHAENGDYGNQNYMKQVNVKAVATVLYSNMGSEVKDVDCPICLAEFVEGENLKVLPHCNHCFHAECIDKWLACNPSCPSCRQSLLQ
ncbi:hypothetical protein SUGI_0796310 [Cryptomeria japonica]|uniref:RING-H2 finger protein ATL74 n=1 Tax=Cryptomeria japonica TaxID=3369 RepID=UPI002414C1AA|nr:RING-H2 finger protein ATL74 [Cryptomeria japonica]GLJ39062.1 hypothetical protein SUGI_0796310 [Cryptomeria japonica]